ncbi:MAG TPA: hypothetical protein DGG95_01935 [Cytophagales bacterium]|jgi:hypothetical protein|nr:hypothetical protein [Cytophagales bacterium]
MKLFNTLRQKLLQENKTMSYLKYALGEILLVVIGILLAMKINTWNENSKDHETEIYILTEILSNLKEERLVVDSLIGKREKARIATAKMLRYLADGKINEDSLSAHLVHFLTFERYFPISNAYQILKSKGLKLSNRTLTSHISRYYDWEQNRISRGVADIEEQIKPLFLNMNGIRRFLPTITLNKTITVVHADDPNFRRELFNEINNFKDNNNGTLDGLLLFMQKNTSLIKEIEEELKQLSK